MASALGRPGTVPPGLRCRVALVGRQVGGAELVCWAEEFPAVRETLVVSVALQVKRREEAEEP